eukprot:SAG11_NODE_11193_length_777_cov_1.731563_1_plen_113_part_01
MVESALCCFVLLCVSVNVAAVSHHGLNVSAAACTSPLSSLPALTKRHYSWPTPFVSSSWLGGAQVDFVRITGSLPLYLYSDCGRPSPVNNTVGQNRTEVFEAVKICHLVAQNR